MSLRAPALVILALALALLAACGDDAAVPPDAAVDAAVDAARPPDASPICGTQGEPVACCHVQEDCQGGTLCAAPGSPPGCGTCNDTPGSCDSDADCDATAGLICEPIACGCSAQKACVPGCVTSGVSCPEGESCFPESQKCGPSVCGNCPDTFDCSGLGRCIRRLCDEDADCVGAGGSCVLGKCYTSLGECRPPVP